MIELTKRYCTDFITSKCSSLPYHDILHTREVVNNVIDIIDNSFMNDEDSHCVIVAAWFHDTGFSTVYDGHEEESVDLAETFLRMEGYEGDRIDRISKIIRATKMPQNPQNELSEILCDADLAHLSSANFFYRNQLLRLEWAQELGKKFTDYEWYEKNLEFLESHSYYTEYANNFLEKGKDVNKQKISKLISHLR